MDSLICSVDPSQSLTRHIVRTCLKCCDLKVQLACSLLTCIDNLGTYDELRSDSQTPESSCDSESLACESASEQEVGITPEAARSPSSSSALKIQLRSGRSCSPGGLERQASSVSASATVENQGDERNKSPASSIWYYVNDIRASRGFRYLSIFMATLFVLGGIIALTWYLCNSLEKSLAGQVNSTCVEICRNKTIPKSDVSEAKSAVHKIFDWVFVHGPQSPVPIKTHLLST